MKKLSALCCLVASVTAASGQGLINFFNGPSTLVSVTVNGFTQPATGAPQSYFFGLLTSPVGSNTFTFSGVYGTNLVLSGLFNGGTGVAVKGWAPGTARDFEVIGWDPLWGGVIFNPAWLTDSGSVGETIYWGFSAIGTGVAGGITSSGTLPNLDIFGGTTGIQQGFTVSILNLVPEPSSLALAAFGVVLFLVFRRREAPNEASAGDCAVTPCLQIDRPRRAAPDRQR